VKYIGTIAKNIEERFPIVFESLWCDQDHIHILCSFPPTKYRGWEVIWIFKSITAKELFKQFPNLKKDLWWWEFWSDGYYFSTVGEKWWKDVIKKYVENQGKTMWSSPQLHIIF
jgi:putative transposase